MSSPYNLPEIQRREQACCQEERQGPAHSIPWQETSWNTCNKHTHAHTHTHTHMMDHHIKMHQKSLLKELTTWPIRNKKIKKKTHETQTPLLFSRSIEFHILCRIWNRNIQYLKYIHYKEESQTAGENVLKTHKPTMAGAFWFESLGEMCVPHAQDESCMSLQA